MVVVDDCKEKAGSQQHEAEIFDCFAHIRITQSHFYAKPGYFKDCAPIENNLGILEHDGFISGQFAMKHIDDL